jgi:hypothetical protein
MSLFVGIRQNSTYERPWGMGESAHLRLSEVRRVFRLLGEVRELGNDPRQWREHELEGLMRLTGANLGFSGLEPVPLRGNLDDLRMFVDVGWQSPAQRQMYLEYMQSGAMLSDPSLQFLKVRQSYVRLRREFVDDSTWYSSPTVDRYHRGGGCDDVLYSRRVVPLARSVDMITLRRPWGDKPFSRRSKRLVALFHAELARLWQRKLATSESAVDGLALAGDLRGADLPWHLQQIVAQLRVGHSEKEAAAALGLSPHTVHTYAKELYSRLAVHSRGEAMANLQWTYDFVPRLV